ncbi:3-hydroxyisobutyrate dehydrogenase-like beta-hydroxyacid dehydrogenase [Algoriphagus sp. 4150]|uniref:NAD(P)-dependent oxidoreductase n=1 Tax=Algoriphagus sp. 4150 TaxID=2817756 RepID=UPI00286391D9|nr:NAD(P)-binding domain-containing protein [Algoriphagus sp. 4150]MDR7132212.1 3-hydroxyisobutyrate dehydrogenase-like beta-hydroxyacid dehydrogenase [Algoriphagus sp. 4150]
MKTTDKPIKISILGLGQMGKKLAQLYVDAGFEVTVWNRSISKALDLENVKIANTPLEAISESAFNVICVSDNNAVLQIINSLSKETFAGKTLLNLTTGSPKEAGKIEAIIHQQGGNYINGALQVAPDQMGLEGTTVLLSGLREAYLQNKSYLDILGGNLKYLGESASASSAMDLATLTWLYGSYIGLIYGVKLSQEYGLQLEDFSEIVGEITPGYTEFFKHEIDVINRGDFGISQSPLPISVSATKRIAESFGELNVIQEYPNLLAKILAEADQKGLHNEELAAIIKVIGKQIT